MAEISRRRLLGGTLVVAGAAAGAVLGLSRPVHHKVATPPPAAPVGLVAALDRQRALLAGYDRLTNADQPAGAGRVELQALRADVIAHGDALRALLELYPGWRWAQLSAPADGGSSSEPGAGGSASTSASAGGSVASAAATAAPPVTTATLAAASNAAAVALVATGIRWPAGEPHAGQMVPVLCSIAACLSSHSTVLS